MVDRHAAIEAEVYRLVEEYNAPGLFSRRRKLSPTTDLDEDLRMDPLDVYELLERYTEQFGIEPKTITFDIYFPEDLSKKHPPLTIELLIKSAQAGSWQGQ